MTYENALTVLADTTRREVFMTLKGGPLSVTQIAQTQSVSRPAVSQHLKILKGAGLVQDYPQGTRRIYSIRREGLTPLKLWLEDFWDELLDAYKTKVEDHVAKRNG